MRDPGIADHEGQTFRRQIGRKRQIGRARFPNAQCRGRKVGRTAGQNSNDDALSDPAPHKAVGDDVGFRIEIPIGDDALTGDDGRAIGLAGPVHHPLEQFVEALARPVDGVTILPASKPLFFLRQESGQRLLRVGRIIGEPARPSSQGLKPVQRRLLGVNRCVDMKLQDEPTLAQILMNQDHVLPRRRIGAFVADGVGRRGRPGETARGAVLPGRSRVFGYGDVKQRIAQRMPPVGMLVPEGAVDAGERVTDML